MKHLFYGDDQLSLRNQKQYLVKEFCQKNPDGKIHVFSFGEKNEERNIEEEMSAGFFSEKKILICEDMSVLFENNPERAKKILCADSEHEFLFIENQKLLKSSKFLQFVQKTDIVLETFEKKERNITKMIQDLEVKLGMGSLETSTRKQIEERSVDGEQVLQNVRKVLTYASGKKISKSDVEQLVPVSLETKVFDALDALVSGQKEKAFIHFQILSEKEDIFGILPLCAWQIRQMLLVNESKEAGGKEVIAKETGIHPFVVQKILRVLPQFSRGRLARGLQLLSSLDVEIKIGKRTPEGALQYFVFNW